MNVVSDSKTMVGWRLAQGFTCQARGHSVLCGRVRELEFLIRIRQGNCGKYTI